MLSDLEIVLSFDDHTVIFSMAFSSSFVCTYGKRDSSFLRILRLTRRACKNVRFGSWRTTLLAPRGKVATEHRSSCLVCIPIRFQWKAQLRGPCWPLRYRSFTNRTLCITRLHDHGCMYITVGSRTVTEDLVPYLRAKIPLEPVVPRDSLHCAHAIACTLRFELKICVTTGYGSFKCH